MLKPNLSSKNEELKKRKGRDIGESEREKEKRSFKEGEGLVE